MKKLGDNPLYTYTLHLHLTPTPHTYTSPYNLCSHPASPSVFDEDHSRVRAGNGAENLAIMRHFAFDLPRLARSVTDGISCRKKTMTWNDDKMKALLGSA